MSRALCSSLARITTTLYRALLILSALVSFAIAVTLLSACVSFESLSTGSAAHDAGAKGDAASAVVHDDASTGGSSVGTSDGDAGSAEDAAASPETVACIGYFTAWCQRLADCQNTGSAWAANCADYEVAACPDAIFGPSSGTTLDSFASCASDLGTYTCDAIRSLRYPSCGSPGKVPAGGTCMYDRECASGYCGGSDKCGVCDDVSTDGTCTATVPCPYDQGCSPDGVCGRADVGESCSSMPCKPTLDCIPNTNGDPTCQPPVGVGARCVTFTSGASNCADGSFCNQGVCSSMIGIATNARCDVWGTVCQGGDQCTQDPTEDAGGWYCRPPGAIGDACGDFYGCASLHCAKGVCAPARGGPGSACAVVDDCEHGVCIAGTCAGLTNECPSSADPCAYTSASAVQSCAGCTTVASGGSCVFKCDGCARVDGQESSSSLTLPCAGDVSNSNGQLVCLLPSTPSDDAGTSSGEDASSP